MQGGEAGAKEDGRGAELIALKKGLFYTIFGLLLQSIACFG